MCLTPTFGILHGWLTARGLSADIWVTPTAHKKMCGEIMALRSTPVIASTLSLRLFSVECCWSHFAGFHNHWIAPCKFSPMAHWPLLDKEWHPIIQLSTIWPEEKLVCSFAVTFLKSILFIYFFNQHFFDLTSTTDILFRDLAGGPDLNIRSHRHCLKNVP